MVYREVVGQIKCEYEGTPEEISTFLKLSNKKEDDEGMPMNKCRADGCENEATVEYCEDCLMNVKKVDEHIEKAFTYHAPKDGQTDKYVAIRDCAKELAYLINRLAPESRERALAITNLEQTTFWANAAIARY